MILIQLIYYFLKLAFTLLFLCFVSKSTLGFISVEPIGVMRIEPPSFFIVTLPRSSRRSGVLSSRSSPSPRPRPAGFFCHTDSLNSHRKLFCDLEIFLGALGALVVVIRRLSKAGSLGELYVTRYLCSEYF